ncbi:MAG TPA: ATP-binding protein [Anaerolineales bacterium]|nr:ATP-binding protein [Anaerolineales bacterium]
MAALSVRRALRSGFSLRRDLGVQLLAVYLLFVLPVAIAGLAFDIYSSSRLRSDVEAADLALARAIALETDARIADAFFTVRQLADDPGVRQASPPLMERTFADVALARPDVNLIYRLDADGIMLFHHPVGPGSTVGVDFSFRPYFQAARESDGPLVSEGRISPTTNQPVATTVMPLRDADGRFLGVVATNLALESLSQTVSAIAAEQPPGQGFRVRIVDASGQVIAEPDRARLLTLLRDDAPKVAEAVLRGEEGSQVARAADGTETLHTYVPIPSAGWGVVVQRPAAVAFATARAFHRGLLTALAVFLAGGVLFWIALSRQVIRPLERLSAFSLTVGQSRDASHPAHAELTEVSGRPDQMGHLGRSLERMERVIQERLHDLSTLLDTSRAVISTLDSRDVLDRILEQTARLTGTDRCAIIALDRRTDTFRVKASRGLSQTYIDRLRIDPSQPDSPAMRAIRSGEPIQISDTEADPSFRDQRQRSRAEGYRALLAVPLLAPHASPAALVVYQREPHVFTEREVRLVWSFANHAAMAIENAELFARSDEQLQEETHRLEALIQSLADGLVLEGPTGRVLYANRRLADLTGISPEELPRLTGEQIRARLLEAAEDLEAARRSIELALKDHLPQKIVLRGSDGGVPATLRLRAFDVTDSTGEVIGRGMILRDVTRDAELDRMKDSLVATVSHELRTPLAAIKGYASTLLARDVTWAPEAQREFLEIIGRETDRLSLLVDDLLDLSRLEAGNLIVARESWSLLELIEAADRGTRPSLGDRLKVEVPPDLPMVPVDRRRIESVLRNLLENAARYAGGEAIVRVSAVHEDSRVIVRVEDDGPGIPESEIDRVFEPFFRLDRGLVRRGSGAGLGLSISRGFVRAHGGDIWIEKRPRGACLAFSIPLTPHA